MLFRSSSACAISVDTGGLFVKIGAASRMRLWIGLLEVGAPAAGAEAATEFGPKVVGVGADAGAVAGASLVTTLDIAISGFVEAMLGGWRGKVRG